MLRPFSRFCVHIGAIPESIIKSMSYEEQLLRLIKFIKETIIPAIDGNADAIEELQSQMVTLQNYVNEYFNNLDVQEEINNKLDNMAKDGSLTILIKNYVDPKFNELSTEVNNTINNQNGKIYDIENKVNSVASGSPAGVYDTIASLQQADPDHSKIYLVKADGEWYFYNQATSQWKNGGVYQATSNQKQVDTIQDDIDLLSTNTNVGSVLLNKIGTSSGGNIQLTTNNGFDLLKIDLANYDLGNKKIKTNFYAAGYLYAVLYTNGTQIIKQEYLHTSEQPNEQRTNIELTIPDNCTNIYINSGKDGYLNAYVETVDETVESINYVKELRNYISIISEYKKGYYSTSGGRVTFNANAGYLSAYADVEAGDKLHITLFANRYLNYILLADENDVTLKTDFLHTTADDNLVENVFDMEYTIPNISGVAKIYVNSFKDFPLDIKKLDYTKEVFNNRQINCWGDSLTDGSGSSDNQGYITYLQSLLGSTYNVNNYGIAGERTNYIGTRRGVFDLYINPVNIDSNNEIPITLSDYKLSPVENLFSRGGRIDVNEFMLGKFAINPVVIGDIKGIIKESPNGAYTFKKLSGSNINITRPAKIHTLGSYIKNNSVDIFWCGTNDIETSTAEEVVDMIKLLISKTNSKNYIVLGMTVNRTRRSEYNELMQKNFGENFIDIYHYLITYGLQDEGITPTAQDIQDIQNGYVPLSLTANDKVHFNNYGYEVIANQIYKKGKDLNYWN